MGIIEIITTLVAIIPCLIDNIVQYIKSKLVIRMIMSGILVICALIIIISYCWERNGIKQIKDSITKNLTDTVFYTKFKSENELEDELRYIDYDPNKSNTAISEMLKDGDLIVVSKEVSCSEFNKKFDVHFLFLSRQIVKKLENEKSP